MQEKLKILTIGDYKDSTLENYFKDNKNIEFLELALNENIEKLNNKISNRDVIFLRSKEDNLEKLLEVGRALKEKEIITTTILEEKLVMENKEDLKKSIDAIFPVNKKGDIENLLLELLKMIDNIIFGLGFINLDIEDVKNMLKDSGITVFGSLKINKAISEEVIIKNINYPFYSKTLKDSKKILIFLDTLEDVELTESGVITDILKNESSKNIEDLLFSIRINNDLKNKIECSFIAGKFQK
ncbi:cell division protein FtsZ [Fusobacterium nucleatum]|uniref:Cell division protein FtsZ n=1 Tax=Fusobacterium nucleatum subsp. polymorphum TaxID=76857 RepID=A0A2C6AXM1_FUSNP|nr:cell division protein FtsZ [Fusobacterium polymorphum]PHH96663.1 cell division protein FtsZ [Fusobacterium polymorphum]